METIKVEVHVKSRASMHGANRGAWRGAARRRLSAASFPRRRESNFWRWNKTWDGSPPSRRRRYGETVPRRSFSAEISG